MTKDKTNDNLIKKMEKDIKSWENEKSYPSLEDIYQMAYIIKINPGELLAIRNRGRKQFFRESDDPPTKRHDWIQISDNFSIGFGLIVRTFLVFALIIFAVVVYKFTDTYFGETAGIVTEQIVVRDIQNWTEPENMVNDGTVRNMVKRVKNESTIAPFDMK